MGKATARGGTTRGGSSIRGGKTRGSASGRGTLTSKSIRGGSTSPIKNTVVARVVPTNRGKGKDSISRTKDANIEKNASKESEKKVYKVRLTNVVVKKLIAAKLKGSHMKIKTSDKMEIDTGEGEKIQLNLSSPKKAEMIFIRNDDTVELVGNVIGCASNTTESHAAAKREKRESIAKKLKESYEKETKGKRKVQVLEMAELPSEQEVKTKPKRQKNNSGSSIKVQQSPSMTFVQVPSSKAAPQLSNTAVRGGKPPRGKARSGRARTTVATEVADDDVVEATATIVSARVLNNVTRGGKTTGGGKSTRSRGAKAILSEAPKVSSLIAQPTRGKRGRPAGVTNRTTRGAKTYNTITTRTSMVPKTSAIIKNDNEQQSTSEGNTSSSSKKGKGKVNDQLASDWKPGQSITILTEFRQARKICEDMENDIQGVIEDLGAYESFYHTCASSIKSITKGSTHDYLLRELEKIEKQFGEGSPANKLMQKYLQLEKDIKIIHDELWRAANEGPIFED